MIDAPDADRILTVFYTTPRAGAVRLSDGGGPFGFDVQTALQVDYLINAYGCDGLAETGCFLGDTTWYLARMYPHLPVLTCDIDPVHADFTRHRLAGHPNVTVHTGDSADLLPGMVEGMSAALVFLDAHWGEHWPLVAELRAVSTGVVVIDDFDIGHDRFGYDHYDGVVCGPELVRRALPGLDQMYVGDPYAEYRLPCLQVGRRSGTGYLPLGVNAAVLDRSPMFAAVRLRPQVRMPRWHDREPAASEAAVR